MRISQKGINLIKQFEGCRLTAYLDQVGVPTIGYGSTVGVRLGMTITQDEADQRLLNFLSDIEDDINNMVKVEIDQNQFDALCSFAYNLGPNALKRSTLLTKLNEGDFDAAADNFLKWVMAGGRVDPGLTKRRAYERELFLS